MCAAKEKNISKVTFILEFQVPLQLPNICLSIEILVCYLFSIHPYYSSNIAGWKNVDMNMVSKKKRKRKRIVVSQSNIVCMAIFRACFEIFFKWKATKETWVSEISFSIENFVILRQEMLPNKTTKLIIPLAIPIM